MKLSNRNKGWCEDEDKIISQLVQKYGNKNWAQIAEQLHTIYGYIKKTGKQCRQRWHNHLDPNIVKKSWTMIQEDILFNEHKIYGNKWTMIAQKLPGRTDNSIKNHFYSTIRKSLRRISKFMGSKNSTSKMRQIKPSTLSKILDMVQGTPNQQKKTKEQQNYKQIAHYLMDFARCKLSDRKYVLTQQDNKAFQRILEEMSKINKIYEDDKLVEAKLKKEKLLQKNFDEASQSQLSQHEQKIEKEQQSQQSQIIKNNKKIQQNIEIFITRSNRKVKPPSVFQTLSNQKKQRQKQKEKEKEKEKEKQKQKERINIKIKIKQKDKPKQKQKLNKKEPISFLIKEPNFKQDQNNFNSMKSLITHSPIYKIQNRYEEELLIHEQPKIIQQGNEIDVNKFEFLVDLGEQEYDREKDIYELSVSPGIRNTPMDLTPKTYQFMRQLQHQPLKNQDCNLVYNKIIHDIKRNTNCELEVPQKPLFIRSPSSAFRQYC